ncbi:MAG TPA: type I-B CRISPR-associated protein Cas5b [Thermotogota bacterium]|jgi:CRISPR-associated protein Cas5h|nr:type I-B CRISPR-associated protein Cas5 [Thermotogaceae bacterium]OQC30566.1 MAG: CRISPR-associated protein (Cas_Cas5) [Thermotogota bacterium ADurb.Bin062]HNW47089.1 type I-B CRISPR-associated protein Cas5b [Thermotogota bacterium]HOD91865.1 type I-B CRISPR-associated protein Cas5b [Thermotogota bacterium]HOF24331.1 type I-B CRISPR-associated protein Cas5b [Thermotogota bacterium]
MACVFDISGRYAMFRKSYTTTSSISFPFPPPTAVAGIIGAILGIVHNAHRSAECADYWNEMGGTRVAIGINRPIKWYRTGINFTNTKSNKTSDHTQIKHQFIKEPSYRIYVDGPLEDRLCQCLKNQHCHFSPYLGVAYCEARIDWVGQYPIRQAQKNRKLDSVLPLGSTMPKIDIRETGSINQTLMPLQMSETRMVTKTVSVLYKTEKSPIVFREADETEVMEVGEDVISWFAPW